MIVVVVVVLGGRRSLEERERERDYLMSQETATDMT